MVDEKSKPVNSMLAINKFMQGDAVTQKLKEILGDNLQTFISSALQAVSDNALLSKASPESVYRAVMAAAVMRLPINKNLGHAYIVPYKGQAQLQIGWKGFVQLALRTKEFETIHTTKIYENQYTGENVTTGEIEIENVKGEGKIVGYLAYFSLLSGFKKCFFMDDVVMEKHAKKYSKSYKKGSGVWADGEDGYTAMAKKTVLKLLLSKFAPLSIDMQKAIEIDQAVINEDGVEYPDNDHKIELTGEEKKEELKGKKESGETVAPDLP